MIILKKYYSFETIINCNKIIKLDWIRLDCSHNDTNEKQFLMNTIMMFQ